MLTDARELIEYGLILIAFTFSVLSYSNTFCHAFASVGNPITTTNGSINFGTRTTDRVVRFTIVLIARIKE